MTQDMPAPIVLHRHRVFAELPPEAMRAEHMLASFALVAFSALVLLFAGFAAMSDWQFRRSALQAQAEVLELRGEGSKIARVRFVDADGAERVADATGPFNGVHAAVGDRITILYVRGRPEWVSHDDPARNWIGPAMFAAFACVPLLPLPFMWRQVRRQEARHARLVRRGLRRPAEKVRVAPVRWGKFTRWALVVTWRDGVGRVHETPSGPFRYEPDAPDPAQLQVLEDPEAPERSIIAPETLPPSSRPPRPARGASRA
jgi:hypothetical protein